MAGDEGSVSYLLGPDDLTSAFRGNYIGQMLTWGYALKQLAVAALLLTFSPWVLGPAGADRWFVVHMLVILNVAIASCHLALADSPGRCSQP